MTLLKFFRTDPVTGPDYSMNELLNSLKDVVFSVSDGDQLQYVNHCWETLTGVSKKDTVGRVLTSFFHPEDISIWQNALHDVAETRLSQLIWVRLVGPDDELRWCEMRLQSMRAGSLYPISATLCDITPQVRKEEVRHASLRSLNGLIRGVPAMLFRSRNNLSWTMEYVSDGCLEVTGYPAEQLMNQSQLSYGSMIDPQDAGYVWTAVQDALNNNTAYELKYRICDAEGKRRTVREKGRGIYSASGQVLGVQGAVFDSDSQ